MGEEKKEKKYNTQELLSLNMDRLKEYMTKLHKEAASGESTTLFEIPTRKGKATTRIGKTPSQCRALALFNDPFKYVELVSSNDARPKTQRFTFERAGDYAAAVSRMLRARYDLVLLHPHSVKVPESEGAFSSADFILLCHGQMRSADVYFLAKKRWFVVNCMEGATNQEKVDSFRKLRETYSGTTFVYMQTEDADPEAEFLSNVRKVRVVKASTKNLPPLFSMLDQIAAIGTED